MQEKQRSQKRKPFNNALDVLQKYHFNLSVYGTFEIPYDPIINPEHTETSFGALKW